METCTFPAPSREEGVIVRVTACTSNELTGFANAQASLSVNRDLKRRGARGEGEEGRGS